LSTEAIMGVKAPCYAAGRDKHRPSTSLGTTFGDYWALTKPEINFLIAIAAAAGFCVGRPAGSHEFRFLLLIHTLLGTLLVASGSATLNQYIERRFDAQMRRTAKRPLAAGRMRPSTALCFGITLAVAGAAYLALATNIGASLLAVATLVSYLFLYTPLKRKTPLCTMVGAVPGAMPPLIGAAASGRISSEASVLFFILFLWQFPHFMSIAWMYRDDYNRASFVVLPHGGPKDRFVMLQTILPLLALVPVSLVPVMSNANLLYSGATLFLSLGFLRYGIRFVLRESGTAARRLLMASIIYLPLMFVVIVLGR
jgi:protoheme IX farnesyltransferase